MTNPSTKSTFWASTVQGWGRCSHLHAAVTGDAAHSRGALSALQIEISCWCAHMDGQICFILKLASHPHKIYTWNPQTQDLDQWAHERLAACTDWCPSHRLAHSVRQGFPDLEISVVQDWCEEGLAKPTCAMTCKTSDLLATARSWKTSMQRAPILNVPSLGRCFVRFETEKNRIHLRVSHGGTSEKFAGILGGHVRSCPRTSQKLHLRGNLQS